MDYLNKIVCFFGGTPFIMFIVGMLVYFVGYESIKIWGPDNVVEEVSELVLEKEFNIKGEYEK
jgi:hypothetical protein